MTLSARTVARYGYDHMKRGETIAIHGVLNKLGVASTRVMSRQVTSKIGGFAFKFGVKK